jgi:hypothetical protein
VNLSPSGVGKVIHVTDTVNETGTNYTSNFSLTVTKGTAVNLKAVPNTGYEFDKWLDSNGTSYSPDAYTAFVIADNVSLTAYFKQIPTKTYKTVSKVGNYTEATMTYPSADAAGATDQISVAVKNKYSSSMYIGVVIYVSGTEIYNQYDQFAAGATKYPAANFTMPSDVEEAGVTAKIYYYATTDWVEDIALIASIEKM